MENKAGSGWVANLQHCTRCLLPETLDTIEYDEEGICNVCRQQEFKKERVDWAGKEQEFREIIDEYRGKYSYDCIVPFSGGKDSTYTLYHLVTKYKLKPLAVRFDHGFLRPNVLANTERTMTKLGVSFLNFRPDWKVVQKLMLESLKRKGDFCWHCHTGIFAYPMQIAIKFNIKSFVNIFRMKFWRCRQK